MTIPCRQYYKPVSGTILFSIISFTQIPSTKQFHEINFVVFTLLNIICKGYLSFDLAIYFSCSVSMEMVFLSVLLGDLKLIYALTCMCNLYTHFFFFYTFIFMQGLKDTTDHYKKYCREELKM